MNSLSTEYKRHKAIGLGRKPHPFENVDIVVNVTGHSEYSIDLNTFDIVEGDNITVKFVFDESWDKHFDRKCSVSIDDRIEVFDLVDDMFSIPRHLVVNCDIRLIVKGYYSDPKIIKGCKNINGRIVVGDVEDDGILHKLNGRFFVTSDDYEGLRTPSIIVDGNGHLVVIDNNVKPRPSEYDNQYSEDNEFGYIKLDMSNTPIKIGSWYDR